jgi:hypothetical protein
MATADDLLARSSVDGGTAPALVISLATIAVVSSALLIYVSGTFLVAGMLGIKRELQAVLTVPIALAAAYYVVSRPSRILDPLILFSIVKLGTEIALRGQLSYVLDGLAAVFALTVLASVPARSFEIGARFTVILAGILALMGLVQWGMLMWDPALGKYGLVVSDEETVLNTVEHPIALLGFIGSQDYTFLGHPVVRMQSFSKEPSLNVVYFMLPACMALLRGSGSSLLWGSTILTFCVLSLSGSVFLTLGFTAVWWLLLRVIPVRIAVPYGILILMGVFLWTVEYFGYQPLMDGITYIAQYGDFFTKTVSLTDRTTGAVAHMDAALASPFGSATISDLPGPWLVNSALAAGWLGVLLLVWFLIRLGRQLDVFQSNSEPMSARRFGGLLLVGALATVVVFNDYQMGNYTGLVLLAFIYRTVQLRNQGAEAAKPLADRRSVS